MHEIVGNKNTWVTKSPVNQQCIKTCMINKNRCFRNVDTTAFAKLLTSENQNYVNLKRKLHSRNV